jgi:hypothetical protein
LCIRASGAEHVLYRNVAHFLKLHSAIQTVLKSMAHGSQLLKPLPPSMRNLDRESSGSEAEDRAMLDAIARRRRLELHTYMDSLLSLPSFVIEATSVSQFFKPRLGDTVRPGILHNETRSPRSPYSRRGSESRSPYLQGEPGTRADFNRSSSDSGEVPPLPTRSMRSVPSTLSSSGGAHMPLKIKIVHGADIMALRCHPASLTHASLLSKIAIKLFGGDVGAISRVLWCRPNPGGTSEYVELSTEESLLEAVDTCPEKMVLYVQ